MQPIIDYCLKNSILVFDGQAEEYDSLTKRLLYLVRQEYKRNFSGTPKFYFESSVSKSRLKEIGLEQYETLDEESANYFFQTDQYCKRRDEHVFIYSDGVNGIVGVYT